MKRTRRELLAGSGLALTGLAGCTELADELAGSPAPTDDEEQTTADGDSEATGDSQTEATADARTETTASTEDLDLREANVTAVEFESSDGGYRFSVTLVHDDDGEDGYANWWQVERLDGERLGRRELAHAHGTREFTRSTTVAVPDGVDCVVVRGHDQTHGYGGRAMLVSLDSGGSRAVDQGPDPDSFGDASCP